MERYTVSMPLLPSALPLEGEQGVYEMTESVECPWLPIGGAARRAEGAT